MGCSSDYIISALKRALKKEDLRGEVRRLIRECQSGTGKSRQLAVKAGHAYFINDKRGHYAYQIFKQIMDRGYRGMCISRSNPESLEIYGENYDVRYVWLSTVKAATVKTVSPADLAKLLQEIKSFLSSIKDSRGVVIIHGAEAIITNTDFYRFLKLVQTAKDSIAQSKGILLIPINLDTLDKKEQEILSSELMEIPIKKS
jgi:hypothetical protein